MNDAIQLSLLFNRILSCPIPFALKGMQKGMPSDIFGYLNEWFSMWIELAALRARVARTRRLGFGGMLCIHSKQVSIAVRSEIYEGV